MSEGRVERGRISQGLNAQCVTFEREVSCTKFPEQLSKGKTPYQTLTGRVCPGKFGQLLVQSAQPSFPTPSHWSLLGACPTLLEPLESGRKDAQTGTCKSKKYQQPAVETAVEPAANIAAKVLIKA